MIKTIVSFIAQLFALGVATMGALVGYLLLLQSGHAESVLTGMGFALCAYGLYKRANGGNK